MNPEKVLNVAKEIKGMPVIELERGQKRGQIVDVIVHPTEGFVMGLVLVNLAGDERILVANDCFVYREWGAIVVTPEAWDDLQQIQATLNGGVRVCEKLLGVEVITKSGQSLGRVVAVYATETGLRTIYRVAASRLPFFVRGGRFLPGDLPLAWVEKGARLIVPAEATEHESFSTLDEALKLV